MDFGYEIVRLWQQPVEAVLAGGVSLLPLATLCQLPQGMTLQDGARWAVLQMIERLERKAAPEVTQRLKTAAWLLAGLRFRREQAFAIFAGVQGMRESSTYRMILDEGRDEGRVQGAQRLLLHLGRKRLGEANEAVRAALLQITDLDRLDRLSERFLDASTWDDLLQTT